MTHNVARVLGLGSGHDPASPKETAAGLRAGTMPRGRVSQRGRREPLAANWPNLSSGGKVAMTPAPVNTQFQDCTQIQEIWRAEGASDLRRDYHLTEYPDEAGHKQAERDLAVRQNQLLPVRVILKFFLEFFSTGKSGLVKCFYPHRPLSMRIGVD
jgi:hypothetical protein